MTEQWVMGDYAAEAQIEDEMQRVGPQLITRYTQDWIRAWEAVLGNIKLRPMAADKPTNAMTLEHYPGMTEAALHDIARQATARWPLDGIRIVHRIGRLSPGDPIVLVMVASAHRRAAFEACDFLMDYLKTRAPFWKKEHTASGTYWVSARDSDAQDAARWEAT